MQKILQFVNKIYPSKTKQPQTVCCGIRLFKRVLNCTPIPNEASKETQLFFILLGDRRSITLDCLWFQITTNQ